jgi:hypothetical protein
MTDVEVLGNEKCPCRSGKTYGACCKSRKFRWVRDKRGRVSKQFPLSKEAAEAAKSALDRFEEIFGRKPRKTDPLFIGKYHLSDADLERETLRAMRAAKVSPSLIYAYQKTSRIVRDPKLLTPDELREYNEAIDEFYDLVESGAAEASELTDPDTPTKTMHKQLQSIQIILGYFLDNHFNKFGKRKNTTPTMQEREFFVGFAVTNFVRCLRSVLLLIENDISMDALNLVRSLYENYLTIAYIHKYPEQIEVLSALLGTMDGSHKFETNKSGIPIQSRLVEVGTNKQILVPSKWRMATQLGDDDKDIYNTVYHPLSSIVHSEITNIHRVVSLTAGFDYLNQDLTLEALLFSLFLALLLMNSLREHSPCQVYLKKDLLLGMGRAILEIRMTDTFLVAADRGALPDVFTRTMKSIASKDDLLQKIYLSTEPDEVIAETIRRTRRHMRD